MRVNVDVEEFLSDLELADRKPKYVRDFMWLLGTFFRAIGKASAEEVTLKEVRSFLASYKKSHSHNSYFMIIWRLRQFFRKRNDISLVTLPRTLNYFLDINIANMVFYNS